MLAVPGRKCPLLKIDWIATVARGRESLRVSQEPLLCLVTGEQIRNTAVNCPEFPVAHRPPLFLDQHDGIVPVYADPTVSP